MSLFEVFHPRKPTTDQLKQLRSQQRQEDLTYDGVGLTLDELPVGYHHMRVTRVVGSGAAHFGRGREAIRTWKAQAALQLVLEPSVPAFVEGEVLVFALPMRPSPFWATGACRIVRIVDEPQRFGFVYGTLPHHPETGEEAFLVHHHDDGTVSFSITAFSNAKALPMRVSGAVGRIIQPKAASIYLDGYEQASKSASGVA